MSNTMFFNLLLNIGLLVLIATMLTKLPICLLYTSCDPVAGLVEIPCIKRNASGVAGAFVAAELALAGIESAIPADEVIWTMKKVGDAMSSTLKETAEGGLAATPTGRRLHEQVFGTVREPKGGCSGCGGCSS